MGITSRTLVGWAPDWPLVAAARSMQDRVAVVSAGTVVACTQHARTLGVRRGMRVRQALARCPDLELLDRNPQQEVRRFEPLVLAFENVAARLEVLRPGLVALPARGPGRFWGSEEQAAARLIQVAAQHGVQLCVGAADTVFAAALAARRSHLVPPGTTGQWLAPYPLGVLGRPRLTDILNRLGITTLGAFAALPTRSVLGRFGTDGAQAHRTARGLEQRGLDARPAPASRSVARDFDPPATDLEPVAWHAKALAVQLHEQLQDGGVHAARVAVRLQQSEGPDLERWWRHEGRLSDLAVAERVRWQLLAWRDTGALTGNQERGGIVRLQLTPEALSPAQGHTDPLFGPQAAAAQLELAAGRLQALLGHTAVTRAASAGGRGPGERIRRTPFGDLTAPADPTGSWQGQLPAPHPAAVFPHLRPARLVDAADTVLAVSGRGELSARPSRLGVDGRPAVPVTGWAGPWPLVEQWWEPEASRRLARLQVTTGDGQAWLLQIRHSRWWAEALYG